MRIMFLSDIHGSPESLTKLSGWMADWLPDQLVILGDVLYHGPRNELRPDYAPRQTCLWLNQYKQRIIAVRGNCDCEVDQAMLEFPLLADYSLLVVDGYKFFLTHGHHFHPGNLPPLGSGDILAYGHTHLPQLSRITKENLVLFNPGSLSLPKGGKPPSFGKYEQGNLRIVNHDTGEEISNMQLEPKSN